MKFTKQSSDHILAHLYEHLFFIHLDTLLRNDGLFPIIDYSVDAFTEDGVIVFDIDTYREIDIPRLLTQATNQFSSSEDLLHVALTQLESEHSQRVQVDSLTNLMDNLEVLNSKGWNSNTAIVTTKECISLDGPVDIRQLIITFSSPDMINAIKPLYRLIAGITLNTLVSDVADTFGGFVASEAFEVDANKNLVAHIQMHSHILEEDIRELYTETVQELTDSNGYRRLLDDLADIDNMALPPSSKKAYTDTGVKVNKKYWTEIATAENLENTLKILNLKIKYIQA